MPVSSRVNPDLLATVRRYMAEIPICTAIGAERHVPAPRGKVRAVLRALVLAGEAKYDPATGQYTLAPPPPATCAPDTTDTIPYIRLRCPFCLQNMRYSRTEGSQNVYTCTGTSHAAEVRIEADA